MQLPTCPRRAAGVLVPALVLGLCSRACAGWPADPGADLAVGDGPGEQAVPKIAAAPGGFIYASWYDGGAGYDVRLQRLDPAGEETWSHGGITVADLGLDWVQDYGLDVDGSGSAILAFVDDRSGREQVTAQLVGPDGALLWGALGIELTRIEDDTFLGAPEAAATDDGGYVIAWSQGAKTRLQKLDRSGAALWKSEVILSDPSGADCQLSDLKASSKGSVIASLVCQVFLSYRHLHAQKLDAGGALLWGASPLPVFESGSIQMGTFPSSSPTATAAPCCAGTRRPTTSSATPSASSRTGAKRSRTTASRRPLAQTSSG